MSALNNSALIGASGSAGYQISRSVRLRSSAAAYLNRTPASASNRKTWTWSGWVKRGILNSYQPLFIAGTTGGQQFGSLAFSSVGGVYDKLELTFGVQAVNTEFWIQTSAVYRDPSAWYHVICAVDTTQATSNNRVKLYINGAQITATSAYASYNQYPSQNYNTSVNNTVQHLIGWDILNAAGYFDGYLTEINFIDGQALTPSSFGEFNAITGVWQPKKYAGTYGTNGFYLNFSDNSAATAAAIGKDSSGNGNNWTPNNISLTAGATYDSMIDTPTPYADGGNGRGNYAVLNAIDKTMILSAGNLNAAQNAAAYVGARGTFGITSGKWYWEMVATSAPTIQSHGLATSAWGLSSAFTAGSWFYHMDGTKYLQGVNTAYGASYTTGDVLGFAFDADAGTITCYKNSVTQGVLVSGLTSGPYFTALTMYGTGNANYNFGQRPFTYTPPTGFLALNTQNLPASTIENGAKHFDILGHSGTGNVSRSLTGLSFQPDLWWSKDRIAAYDHYLFDSVRGTGTKSIKSNTTEVEGFSAIHTNLTSFDSGGVTIGVSSNATNLLNRSGATYVDWFWKAGGAAVTNTAGSISSQVSANVSAGFSVVTYTGTGANATVGHGLGVAPKMVIVKIRNKAYRWMVYFAGITTANTDCLFLNETSAKSTLGTAAWQVSSMSSTVIGISTNSDVNENTSTFVAYCFAEVAGYSKFGSYTGNGSTDGTFVYLGFRPRYVMVKASGIVADWLVYDTARDTYNVMNAELFPNTSGAEQTVSTNDFDFLSNGFKCRRGGTVSNQNGATYIYMAFAENPFKNALAR